MNKAEKTIFDNFIVSDCNIDAYKMCVSFLNDPQGKFIALFGPTASGKTYLLSALQKKYHLKCPNANIRATTFDELISEYIEVLQCENKDQRYTEFRAAISNYDLLIVDNMQFIAGKTYTQEEFSHWFLQMIHNNKSVILAFDRPAKYFDKVLDSVKCGCSDCHIVELKSADSNFKKQYLDGLLENMNYDIPVTVRNVLIYDSSVPFHSFYGYISKLQFLEKIVGRQLSKAEMFECLTDYKHINK